MYTTKNDSLTYRTLNIMEINLDYRYVPKHMLSLNLKYEYRAKFVLQIYYSRMLSSRL